MKNMPHYMNKVNRRIVRSMHREESEAETVIPSPRGKQTEKQIKKQAKAKIRQERRARVPQVPSKEEQNKKQARRTPVFGWDNQEKPKTTRPTRKKTPRL